MSIGQKVKFCHSIAAIITVGVRSRMCLGHSILKAESVAFLSLPLPSMVRIIGTHLLLS